MRKLSCLTVLAIFLVSATSCSSPNALSPKASPTPSQALATLPHKPATPTPTLAGRIQQPIPTLVPSIQQTTPTEKTPFPTIPPAQLQTCLNTFPTDAPDTPKQMASGSAKDALPLVACDNFIDNSNSWSIGNWNGNYVQGVESIKDGVLGWQGVAKDGGVWYDFPQSSPDLSDFTLVINARILKSPANTQIGIVYRYDADNFYMVSFSSSTYEFYLYKEGQWETLLDQQPFPASFDDTTKPGWITLDVKGNTQTLYFNNERVDSIQDNRLPTGTVGLGIQMDASADQAQIEFYHFILRGQ